MVHGRVTRATKDIELVALCDMDKPKLEKAAADLGVKKTYTNFGEMLDKECYDLVDIITPPTIRVGIVEEAIAHGAKAILLEKPIALRPSEGRRLEELGKKTLIAINTQYQWMPHWQKFWKLLAVGKLGSIETIRVSTLANILEQGPHVLDLALNAARISGLPWPETVLAAASGLERFGKDPVPADVTAIAKLGDARLIFTHGESSVLVPNEKTYWYHIQVDIIGDRGRLWVSLNQGWKLWICSSETKEGVPRRSEAKAGKFQSGPTGWPKNDSEAQTAMMECLRDTIRKGKEAEFPTRVEIANKISDLFFACYESALTNKTIPLPAQIDDGVVERLERLGKK